MFQPRDPRQSHSDPRQSHDENTRYTYLEDMDVYDEGFEEDNQWFPWVAALGLGGACIGIGLAFSWLLSPVPSTANRGRSVSEPTEIARAEADRDNPSSPIDGSRSSTGSSTDAEFDGLNARSTQSRTRDSSDEEESPLGIPLTDLPLIPVDPAATSRARPSRITDNLNADRLATTESSPETETNEFNRSARDSEVLSRDGEIAVNPDLRPNNELWSESESSRESERPSQYFLEDSDAERRAERRDDTRETRTRRDGDREVVENSNVAVATTTSPRLDLGPSFGEGSYLVLMAYQGDNSLSQARKYSQGAFIKQLDGETYVQLAAFDQLEYARHMADNLRSQGVAVLILQ